MEGQSKTGRHLSRMETVRNVAGRSDMETVLSLETEAPALEMTAASLGRDSLRPGTRKWTRKLEMACSLALKFLPFLKTETLWIAILPSLRQSLI